jgi:hypothetical protein
MTASELTAQLRAARPIAPESLRERVRVLAASEPAPAVRRRLPEFRMPSLRIAVPVVAATALAAASIFALVRPDRHNATVATKELSSLPAATVPTPPSALDTQQAQGSAVAPSTAHTAPQPFGATRNAAPVPTPGRAQRYQAELTISVKNGDALSSATARAQTTVRALGGYVVNVSFASADSGAASLTLRVPTQRVQEALARLSSLGKVVGQQVQIDDLQSTLDQLSRRITVLRARIFHITALLTDPTLSSVQRADLETQRTELQNALRQTRQNRSGISAVARNATIELQLQTARKAVAPPPSRADRTLHQAARVLAWEGAAMLYVLVVLGPFVILGAALAFAAKARRRSEESRLLARS